MSNSTNITVGSSVNPPHITSVYPNSVVISPTNQVALTIVGTGLKSSHVSIAQSPDNVNFYIFAGIDNSSGNDTSLTFNMSRQVAGTYYLRIDNPAGISNSVQWVVLPTNLVKTPPSNLTATLDITSSARVNLSWNDTKASTTQH